LIDLYLTPTLALFTSLRMDNTDREC
jgi:hypothetical protein